jgi:XTP/dITP diphosphohydrolase
MKLILASSNSGKIKEFKELFPNDEVIPYSDILGKFEIIEDGESFQENAIIKAKTIYEKLDDKDSVVISDDSGISLPILNQAPGIYSARYAGENATTEENLNKLISKLNEKNLTKTNAYYTACLAIASKYGLSTAHGWMYGDVINEKRGSNGFGYDPIFIPNGFDKTLGELDSSVKKGLSHRHQAIYLLQKLIESIKEK